MVATTQREVSWLRTLLLFQSWRQFQSWAWSVAIGAIVVFLFFGLMGDEPIPPAFLLSGMIFGALPSVVLAIPVRLVIHSDNGVSAVVPMIHDFLADHRYLRESGNNENMIFRQDAPRFLRWDEGNVTLITSPTQVALIGPVGEIRRIRKHLKKEQFISS